MQCCLSLISNVMLLTLYEMISDILVYVCDHKMGKTCAVPFGKSTSYWLRNSGEQRMLLSVKINSCSTADLPYKQWLYFY